MYSLNLLGKISRLRLEMTNKGLSSRTKREILA